MQHFIFVIKSWCVHDLNVGDDSCDDDEDDDDAAVIGDLILILFVLNHCLAFSICPRALTKAQTNQLYMYLYLYFYLDLYLYLCSELRFVATGGREKFVQTG